MKLKLRWERFKKRFREKSNERITFLLIPHNERTIVNLQLSNFTIGFSILVVFCVLLASFFAVQFQENIKVEAETLQDKDRSFLHERDQYLRKYHEMALQQKLFKRHLVTLMERSKLQEDDKSFFMDESELSEIAAQELDIEGEQYVQLQNEKNRRTMKFLNFETTLKIAQGKEQEEGFYFHPEVNLYRKLRLDIAQTTDAVARLNRLIKERETVQGALPYGWPVGGGHFTSLFGPRISPFGTTKDFHTGVDLADGIGTPIYAGADGRVATCGYSGGYGLTVRLNHSFGFQTLYGHMSSSAVNCGQYVKKGQLIGRVGMTGRTTGPHLHYEVRILDRPVNPMPYLTSG